MIAEERERTIPVEEHRDSANNSGRTQRHCGLRLSRDSEWIRYTPTDSLQKWLRMLQLCRPRLKALRTKSVEAGKFAIAVRTAGHGGLSELEHPSPRHPNYASNQKQRALHSGPPRDATVVESTAEEQRFGATTSETPEGVLTIARRFQRRVGSPQKEQRPVGTPEPAPHRRRNSIAL